MRYVNFRGTKFKTVIWEICRISEAESESESEIKSVICQICEKLEAQSKLRSVIWEICGIS